MKEISKTLLPHALQEVGGKSMVIWLDPVGLDTSYGFFRDSIETMEPSRRMGALTSLESLIEQGHGPCPEPLVAGLIYQCSRCGSTLLCQMLKQHPSLSVIGEASIVGQILSAPNLKDEERVAALKGMFAAYASWASSEGKGIVFKLSSWQIHFRNWIRTALPTVKELLLLREPESVVESLSRKPPRWLVQRVDEGSLDRGEVARAASEAYTELLQDILGWSINEDFVLVDYLLLQQGIAGVLEHFGYNSSESLVAQMINQCQLYSKSNHHQSPKRFDPISQREISAFYRQLDEEAKTALDLASEAYRDVLGTLGDRKVEGNEAPLISMRL